jgi:hypothetical protein
MNQFQLQVLKDYLIKDNEFYEVYKIALQENIDESLSILSDIVFQHCDNLGDENKRFFNHYINFVNNFINYLDYEVNESTENNLIQYYIMKEGSQGVAWLMIDDNLYINLDDLYDDFNQHCNG